MRSTSSSLAARALLALILTIGFYGLALVVVGVLLLIPYAEIRFAQRLHIRLALTCLIGAGIILWSILPRRDRFEPPGPRLEPPQHPQLFNNVKEIAHKTGQRMPAEVYLVLDANAFVAERGGFMGIGSRRVMGVGLALLQALTISQFRAVLAHEFGHFFGGDTKLGPWIYKTRMAIVRTVLGLRGLGRESWLQIPFQSYAKLFLRVTHAVSRRQEFVADELAARTVGPVHLIDGLRTIHGITPAFHAFWQYEFAPTLNAGFRPSISKGFSHFMAASSVAQAMERSMEREMDSAETNPYDTHPSLQERVTAVQELPRGRGVDNEMLAITLLEGVSELEEDLMVHLFGRDNVRVLKPLEWQDVGRMVYIPAWKKIVADYGAVLSGITPASLPEVLQSPDRLVAQLKRSAGRPLAQPEIVDGVLHVVGGAFALALWRAGWGLDARPGAEISLTRGGIEIQPFSILSELASGETPEEAWLDLCDQAGIGDLDLGEPVESDASPVDKFCRGCGTELKDGARFCTQCGMPRKGA